MIAEEGSFRDEHNRVYYEADAVLRGVSAQALADFRDYSQAPFFAERMKAGRIVRTVEETDPALTAAVLADGWAGVLRHDRVPVISYPYEWPFGMLKAAALLHLDRVSPGTGLCRGRRRVYRRGDVLGQPQRRNEDRQRVRHPFSRTEPCRPRHTQEDCSMERR